MPIRSAQHLVAVFDVNWFAVDFVVVAVGLAVAVAAAESPHSLAAAEFELEAVELVHPNQFAAVDLNSVSRGLLLNY